MKDRLVSREIKTFVTRAAWMGAVMGAAFLGSGCTAEDLIKLKQPPQNPDSPLSTPIAAAGDSHTGTSDEPKAFETYLPAIEAEPQSITIFDGDPRSPEGQALGDKGFIVDQGPGDKILWGPFLRDFDQPEMAAIKFDDSTLEITIDGTGFAKCGATDSKMTGSSFGFHEAKVQLPYTFKIYWPGLKDVKDKDGNPTKDGFGLETTCEEVPDSNQPVAEITGVTIKKLADGNILEEKS